MADEFRDARWWLPEHKGKRHEMITAVVRKIRMRQDSRKRQFLLHAQLYGDMAVTGLGPFQYVANQQIAETESIRLNLVKAVVDTYVSMLVRSRPKPMTLTSKGDWQLQNRAKGLNRWIAGKFNEAQLYSTISAPVARDSAVHGTGIVKVSTHYADPGDPKTADVLIERRFPWELVVDDAEAQDPKALRNLYDQKWIDREVLAEMFPAKRREIMAATNSGSGNDWGYEPTSDLLLVTEAYHLPTSANAKNGRRCIVVDGATLADEPYTRMKFPFAFLRRAIPPFGFWGIAIPHELKGIQANISQTLLDIEQTQNMLARPKWAVPRTSGVLASHISDDVGEIIDYDGPTPPSILAAGLLMPPETYNFLWTVWQKGFDLIGVSQMRSHGAIAQGLSGSGAAIREANDVEDGRFLEASRAFEDWHVEIATLAIEEAREIAKENPDYASVNIDGRSRSVVRFADVDMDRDKYSLAVHPTSALSSSPQAKLAQIDEWYKAGLIDKDEYRSLLDFPDLEASTSIACAPRELADKLIERFLDAPDPEAEGVYVHPEPGWPLDYLEKRFIFAAVRAFLDDAPDANVELLRQFRTECREIIDAAAPPPPPPPPPGQPPMGMPREAPPAEAE